MRIHLRSLALASLAVVVITSCKSPTFGGAKYAVNLSSNPEQATLYLITKDEWNRITDWETRDLRQYKLTDEDGLSPIRNHTIYGYQYVLVAEKDGVRDYVFLRATKDGESFVVNLPKR